MEPFQALCEFLGIVPICSFLVVLFSALGNVLPCEHQSVLESQAPVGGWGGGAADLPCATFLPCTPKPCLSSCLGQAFPGLPAFSSTPRDSGHCLGSQLPVI